MTSTTTDKGFMTFTSREFNQDTGKAKKAADKSIVYITDRGKPKYVLMSVKNYKIIRYRNRNLVDMLTMPGGENIEFNPEPIRSRFVNEFDMES
jgi:hypothetical protein